MSASQDGSESVDQFLARIASVKEGRDQASEERTRRMEEDFLKSRKERQARRLERARSLSPSKTGPSSSTSAFQTSTASRETALNPPVDFSPRSSVLSRSNAVSARTSPTLESKDDGSVPSANAFNKPLQLGGAGGLGRSGTLSWQQRPPRDGATSRPRPMSTIETVRQIPNSTTQQEDHQSEPTRQDIAAALGSKDPSWFRQTQDRGQGSAAFRKNQVEDPSVVEHVTRSHVLPGLSSENGRARTMSPPAESEPKLSSQPKQSIPVENTPKMEASPAVRASPGLPKLDLSPPRTSRPDTVSQTDVDSTPRSSTVLAGRSPSPTKGLGGFVESAMMKRSDSVSKRWSVQASAGLKRGDSIAGARPLSGIRSMHASTLSRNTPRSESPSSSASASRPTSKHGDGPDSTQSATLENNNETDGPAEVAANTTSAGTTARPRTPTENQLSRSPSKGLDARRWSPTKSSWLESALTSKPEPPKIQPKKEDVPAWKATLQRNKASRDLSPSKATSEAQGVQSVTLSPSRKQHQSPFAENESSVTSASQSEDKATEDENLQTSQALVVEDKMPGRADLTNQPSSISTTDQKPNLVEDETTNSQSRLSVSHNTEATASPVTDTKPEKKPPVLKPKPQTPPRTDFRSTLRSRAPTSGEGTGAEPEFKSMFGKLKRAQTQNYVAPDTLKDNIMQGKSALNVTGGPQKTKRVDEFKESILQKKEAMKASAVQKKENPAPEALPSKPEPTVPEALARRKTLHRATSSITKIQNQAVTPAQAAHEQLKSVPKPVVGPKPALTSQGSDVPVATPGVVSPRAEQTKATPASFSPVMRTPQAPPKPDLQPRPRAAQSQSQTFTTRPLEVRQETTFATPQEPTTIIQDELPAGSKLASRLNPNLAAFLSRGSSPRPSPATSPPLEANTILKTQPLASSRADEESSSNAELTHMTKGRARGPKRRAPKSQPSKLTAEPQSKPVAENPPSTVTAVKTPKAAASSSFNVAKSTNNSPSLVTSDFVKRDVSPTLSKTGGEARDPGVKTRQPEDQPTSKPKPAVSSKSPELRRVSSTLSSSQAVDGATKRAPSEKFDIATDKAVLTSSDSRSVAPEKPSTPNPASTILPLTPSKSRVNAPKQAQPTTTLPEKPQSPKPVIGSSILAARPPAPAKSNINVAELTVPKSRRIQTTDASKNTSHSDVVEESKQLLLTHFASLPRNQQGMEFDASKLLATQHGSDEKIKSVSHTIWEINGGGKKAAMPSQQEHILFEESMYLLVHTFETSSNNKVSEAYLWCGDQVADAAIEDAQLFCRKDAREHNAKLEVVKQGQEAGRFFQALGGILIVRRSKSSSLYMLCGRRHLGHIAFDEVEVAAENLCSGFAYLISAKFGKLYLWKGKGSGADEVGCARLIGMDLGLTGEIEEISEGQEPSSFWETFPRGSRSEQLSSDWQQRAEHDCYPTTLYRVEVDQPRSTGGFWGLRAASPPKSGNKAAIEPITPFSHRDLDSTSVHVLDAYRSIYIILNSRGGGKPVEFVTALNLAQELAMLSPSIQDRSLLPTCFVIFGEPARDVQMCFRKWSGVALPADRKSSACIRLEHVMKALES